MQLITCPFYPGPIMAALAASTLGTALILGHADDPMWRLAASVQFIIMLALAWMFAFEWRLRRDYTRKQRWHVFYFGFHVGEVEYNDKTKSWRFDPPLLEHHDQLTDLLERKRRK